MNKHGNSFRSFSLSGASDVSSVEGVYYLDNDTHFRNQDSSFDRNLSAFSSTAKSVRDEVMVRIGERPSKIFNSRYKTRIFAFMGVNIFILGIIIGVVYGNPKKADGTIVYNVTTAVTIEATYMDANEDNGDDLMKRSDEFDEGCFDETYVSNYRSQSYK